MARKNIFSSTLRNAMNDHEADPSDDTGLVLPELGESQTETSASGDQDDLTPRKRSNPNVKIFQRSFQEQMLRSLQDVDPTRIDSSRFKDRLDVGEDLEALKESIKENGQQVPVLLRKVAGDRYEVVYGRRRILACRQLGLDVRAMVVEISDEDALIAQGLENAARLETSYIEKAIFVTQVTEAGYSSDTIHKALGIDKTQASKMRGVVRDIPRDVIMAVGAAHGVGRRPWEALRKILSGDDAPGQARLLKMIDPDLPSPERLKALLAALRKERLSEAPSPTQQTRIGRDGYKMDRTPRSLTVKADRKAPPAFLEYLEGNLERIYEDWHERKVQDIDK